MVAMYEAKTVNLEVTMAATTRVEAETAAGKSISLRYYSRSNTHDV